MRAELLLLLGLGLAAAPCRAQTKDDLMGTDAPVTRARYTPPSGLFTCDVPKGWSAFEEEEGSGPAIHMLGPENAGGTFRSGIDVRFMEKGQPGFLSFKRILEELRRPDEATDRSGTAIRPLRTGAGLARTFEITETRRLPPDRLPSIEEALHRYVAIIPSGDNYFVISLASTRESYLDYRDLFVEFLRTFHPH